MNRKKQFAYLLCLLAAATALLVLRMRNTHHSLAHNLIGPGVAVLAIAVLLYWSYSRQRRGLAKQIVADNADAGCWIHLDDSETGNSGPITISKHHIIWTPSKKAQRNGCETVTIARSDVKKILFGRAKFGIRTLPALHIVPTSGEPFTGIILYSSGPDFHATTKLLHYPVTCTS